MQTQLNQNSAAQAPMVRCHGRGGARRKSIDELLADVRDTEWYALFEDAHLCVAASADIMDVVELIATAPGGPNGRLAGFVEGLWVNN